VVAADRPRRARYRAQREPASSSPDDSAGAAIPRRCVARAARARCRATLECSRSASEDACARRVSRLHARRTPVDTERAGAPTRAKAGGGRPRQGGPEIREEGESAPRRFGKASSVAAQPACSRTALERLLNPQPTFDEHANTCAYVAFRLMRDEQRGARGDGPGVPRNGCLCRRRGRLPPRVSKRTPPLR
jgi:hypothetical protein